MNVGCKRIEMDSIPADWQVGELHSFVRRHNSGVYKKSELYGKGCNIVGVSDLYTIDCVDGQRFSEVPLSVEEQAKYTLGSHDLLYGESSLVRDGIARTVYVTERGAGTAFAWHTRRYAVDQSLLLSPYLYYYLQSRYARKHMMDHSIQTAITGINTVAYFACPVLRPPLVEQCSIAEALSDVDVLLGGLDQLIAKKRDIKQAAMQQLLTGQIRLPGFHGGWEVKRLGDMASLKNGYAFKSDTYTALGTFKVVTIANVQDGYMTVDGCNAIESEPRDLQLHQRLRVGDILISMTGNVGRVCRVNEPNCLLNQRVGKLVPTGTDADFLFAVLRQPSFIVAMTGAAKGGAQPNLSATDITRHSFNIPKDTREQTAIAEMLTDMDAELVAFEQRLEKTRALKQAMMQELLTGRTRLVSPEEAHA